MNDVSIANDGAHGITITRDFDHPVSTVFRALNEPDVIAQWIGPHGYDNVEVTNESRHGGTWTLVQRGPDGDEFAFRGVMHGDPTPELMLRTFEWLGMPGHVSFESLTIEDLGGDRCRIHTTSVFLSQADRDGIRDNGMDQGVIEGYERLDGVLARL